VVKKECERQLEFSGLPTGMRQAIDRRGVLFGEHPHSLAALPLVTFAAAKGVRLEDAAAGGAAMEFLLAAADVLDDIQDGGVPEDDGEDDQALWVRETEILTALLLLGEQSALSLFGSRLQPRRVSLAVSLFSSFKLKAFSGQYMDAHTTIDLSSRPEMSLEITSGKSGSLGRCAGEFGAALATDDPVTVELAGRFGENLAIARQFHDDVANLWPSGGKMDDLTQLKSTLPLTFSMAVAERGNGHGESALAEMLRGEPDRRDPLDQVVLTARDEVFNLGGAHFAMLQAIVHLVRAKTIAVEFERRSPGCGILQLLGAG
jgi:geranylgeranyl pyrophosphate synthase